MLNRYMIAYIYNSISILKLIQNKHCILARNAVISFYFNFLMRIYDHILICHTGGDFMYQLYGVTSHALLRWAFMKGHLYNDI